MNTFYIIIQQVIWFMICGLVILNVMDIHFWVWKLFMTMKHNVMDLKLEWGL